MSEISEDLYRRVERECIRLENKAAKEALDVVEAPAWLFHDMLNLMDGAAFRQMLRFMKETGIIGPEESTRT